MGDSIKKWLTAYISGVAEAAARPAATATAKSYEDGIRKSIENTVKSKVTPLVVSALILGGTALLLGLGSYVKARKL